MLAEMVAKYGDWIARLPERSVWREALIESRREVASCLPLLAGARLSSVD